MTNLKRKETGLHYRKEFKADAVLEILEVQRTTPVEFIIEHRPVGGADIKVEILEELDYPMVPVLNDLRAYIMEMEKTGRLP